MFSLQQAMKYGEESRRLKVAGATIEGPAFLVAFANGRQYGGGAIIAPHAFLDDGMIETVHIARLRMPGHHERAAALPGPRSGTSSTTAR